MSEPRTIAEILNEWRRQMDPQACLRRAAEALEQGDTDEARAALADYASWRRRGGWQPEGGDALAAELRRRLRERRRPGGEKS